MDLMIKMKTRIVTLALLATALAQEPAALYGSFYPSDINSTTWITDDAIGTYHGVYQAGTFNSTTSAPYGTYDYCFMPHPRAEEYVLPAPVANGSVQADLIYLHYIQRHQRRTAYNILPGGEDVAYQCDNIQPYTYAGPNAPSVSTKQPIPMYAATYEDPANPFNSRYVYGTCQYPQLTIGGLLDGYSHGADLWSVYGEKLHFLPASPDSSTWFRSSESTLTQDSAGGVLAGIWPHYRSPLPLHQQPSAVDTVNEGFSCNYRDTLLSSLESTAEWTSHLSAAAPLLADLSPYTQNESAWTSTFDHLADNFQARQCNGYSLPCNINDTSSCVSPAQADEVFRAGDWEWNYYWRTNPNVTAYIQTVEGLFIGEILAGFARAQAGPSAGEQGGRIKYVHDFVHDGDIGPIAGALGITALRWPGMGSNLAFELWRTTSSPSKEVKQGEVYARVLYSGQPIRTIHGVLDWVPLATLVGILEVFVPGDIVALCAQ